VNVSITTKMEMVAEITNITVMSLHFSEYTEKKFVFGVYEKQ
jgi:hypothetical protein